MQKKEGDKTLLSNTPPLSLLHFLSLPLSNNRIDSASTAHSAYKNHSNNFTGISPLSKSTVVLAGSMTVTVLSATEPVKAVIRPAEITGNAFSAIKSLKPSENSFRLFEKRLQITLESSAKAGVRPKLRSGTLLIKQTISAGKPLNRAHIWNFQMKIKNFSYRSAI